MRLPRASVQALATACATTLLLSASSAAVAQENNAPQVLTDVYACVDIEDGAARLACYDAAIGRLRLANERGDLLTIDRSEAQTVEREAFGFTLPSLPRLFSSTQDNNDADEEAAASVEEVALEIDRVSRHSGGAVFYMSNGQVWRQIDTNRTSRVRSGGAVTIRRASMGSFLMSVEAGGPAIRVRREQ